MKTSGQSGQNRQSYERRPVFARGQRKIRTKLPVWGRCQMLYTVKGKTNAITQSAHTWREAVPSKVKT